MQRLTHKRNTIFLIASFAFLGELSATEPPSNIELGRHYLDALYAFNYPELEKMLHADAVFEDPTSAVVSPDVTQRYVGRSAILEFVHQSSNGITDADYQVLSGFSTGEFVVFNLEYSTVFEGEMLGIPGRVFSVKIPAVTILQVQHGLVIHHVDYVDYGLMLEQMAKQRKE